jgi:hypothetical protein
VLRVASNCFAAVLVLHASRYCGWLTRVGEFGIDNVLDAVIHTLSKRVYLDLLRVIDRENKFYLVGEIAMRWPAWLDGRFFLIAALLCASTSIFAQQVSVLELQKNWQLASAEEANQGGAEVSQPAYDARKWHPIHEMPATVLEILEQDGVYPNLYYGMNLAKVPRDLYKKDWWYRTTFEAPTGKHTFTVDFPGINYRAEIWLNGKLLAGNKQVAGMYVDHRFNVTAEIRPGEENALAVKVTPEQLISYVNGVELADSWANWVNYDYLLTMASSMSKTCANTELSTQPVSPRGILLRNPVAPEPQM